jgi:hypothetical protein
MKVIERDLAGVRVECESCGAHQVLSRAEYRAAALNGKLLQCEICTAAETAYAPRGAIPGTERSRELTLT